MKVKNSQKGFTLLEIALAMGVGGLLLSGLVLAIFQTFGTTKQTVNEITALENVQNAAYRITQDVKKAKTAKYWDGQIFLDLGATPESNLVLDWTVWYDADGSFIPNGEAHHVECSLSGKKLQRTYDYGVPTTVANFISDIQFSRQGDIILLTITSSPEGNPRTARQKTFHVYLQPKVDPVQ